MNLLIYNLRVDSNDDVLGFTTEWINGLAKYFDNVYVVTMYLGELAVAKNVRVFSLGQESGYSKLRRLFIFYKTLFFLIRENKISICFSHMNQLFVALSGPILKFKKIPVVLWYAHGHVPFFLRVAHYFSDRIVSSGVSGFRLKTNKLKIVGQGIDVSRFCASSTQSVKSVYRILSVGRISSIKKLELLLHAVSELPCHTKDHRIVEVFFVGRPLTKNDYEYNEYLRKLVKDLGLEGRVKFLDSLPFCSIDKAYKEADLFVNTSSTGSMDKAILEAMASELPVVTSNVAFRELLEDFRELCFVDFECTLSLKNKIRLHLEMEPSKKIILGINLREIVKINHSFDGLCLQITTILKGL